jgi:hypothetical protein
MQCPILLLGSEEDLIFEVMFINLSIHFVVCYCGVLFAQEFKFCIGQKAILCSVWTKVRYGSGAVGGFNHVEIPTGKTCYDFFDALSFDFLSVVPALTNGSSL